VVSGVNRHVLRALTKNEASASSSVAGIVVAYGRAGGQYLRRSTTSVRLRSGLQGSLRPDLNSNPNSNRWTHPKFLRDTLWARSASPPPRCSAARSQGRYREHPARLYPARSPAPPRPRTRNSGSLGNRAGGYGWNLPSHQANCPRTRSERRVRWKVNAIPL
jgi:hypothetical protein